MKITRLLFCTCFVFLALMGCEESASSGTGGTTTNNGKPVAKIDLIPGQDTDLHFSHFDMAFNDVVAGDTIFAVYPFQNMSDHTVKIDEVKLSCYCLNAEYPKGNLAPGAVGEIKVSFATAGQARDVPATHEKMFPVLVNGEIMPMATLKLHGKVLPAPPEADNQGS